MEILFESNTQELTKFEFDGEIIENLGNVKVVYLPNFDEVINEASTQ